MPIRSAHRKHGRPARTPSPKAPRFRIPSLPAHWHRWALTLGLAVTAGVLSYSFFPNPAMMPVADRLLSGSAFAAPDMPSLLGAGTGSTVGDAPAPVVTATAKDPATTARKPAATHSASPSAAAMAGGGTAFTAAAGIGFLDGTSSPSGMETADSWLGSSNSLKYAQDFIDASNFTKISNPWQLSHWQGSPFTMIWGVPMVPCGAPATQCATNVSAYDQVANGGANSYYATLAQNLVAAGFGSSYIRIGWEFNAGWMGWAICNRADSATTSWASDFVPAFRNIVTSMRGVSGANFKFIWNPIDTANANCPGGNLENFYPGDQYVDAVALDAYDGIGAATNSDAARWSDILNGVNAGGYTAVQPASINGQSFQGYGLNWLAAFGHEHNKEISLPEWGLMDSSTDAGGGDDSYYMTQMTQWIKTYASGPALFWNYGGGTLQLDIPNYTNGGTPNATAVFKSAFGA